ncbi:epimerase [Lysinibacter cavernae]|uniref:DUF1731 domain-containing protein n=1 Tax=Lysinibacter cavernae TaxID=1640652 RepID=A0A7X5R4P4_9MICO|nr:DUF1731 domain-containing protein [Lysinibacter cavernae]NIH55265.1 hypothetical protein [Lysinibacter cavernae]
MTKHRLHNGRHRTSGVAVVAGGSGFIGQAVIADLTAQGYQVRTISRAGGDARWGDSAGIQRVIDGSDLLVNLAGKSVNCRYTDANRNEVLRSRVETTRALREAIAASPEPPALWLNASTATIYRYAMGRPQTEADGELGKGFSVDVARAWERELFEGELPNTRRVALRMAIVLGDGPATQMLATLARVGLGGPQRDGRWFFSSNRYRGIAHGTGSAAHPTTATGPDWHDSRGRQRFSWIHTDDVLRAMWHIRDTPALDGVINLSSPNPRDNTTLMRSLRRIVKMPVGLTAHRWMLEPAMFVLRTEPELVLKSRWVLPERLVESGFEFRWPELEPALRNILKR